MHAASGKRLGASHPRQEGPADLRLVPPALAAWATAAVMLHAPPGLVAGTVITTLLLAGFLLTPRNRRAGPGPAGPEPAGPRPGGPEHAEPGHTGLGHARALSRVSGAAVLLCVAAAAGSAGLHGADLRRGPVPELAREYASVTAEVELTADPRLSRPQAGGSHVVPTAVLIEADVRRVETARDGAEVATRAPVLMIVDARSARPVTRDDGQERARGPEGKSSWLGLLPSTRLRVEARLVPATAGGDRFAAVLRVRGADGPETVGEPSAPQRLAGRLRAGLRAATDGLSADARALLPGLVVGDTSRVTPELEEAFRETDLTHTLAVSGANFTILLALLLGPPGLAQYAERRGLASRLGLSLRTTALLGGALSLAFVVVCRPDPSVLRAAACGSVALLALATGRRRSLIPALATAVLLLVLHDPWLARSFGFLLSVLATGALLTLAPRWSAGLRRRGMPPRLAEALAAAGAAQAVCAPVVVVLSERVSLVAVPCNLLAEFALAPATVLGFLALATALPALPVAKALAWCASWPAGWIAWIARTGAALPGSGIDWPGGWAGAALLGALTPVVLPIGRRLLRHPWWCGACALLLVLLVVQPPPLTRAITGWPPPGWRMVMCDVGQGDAMVLAAGEGTGVVVDAGPEPAPVDRCLRSLGVTRVPLVVLTHFHADHVGGLSGVLRGRSVGGIATTGLEEPADQARFVRRLAAGSHLPVTRAVAGERRRTGDLSWEVVWPPPATGQAAGARPVPEAEGPNDASVAMLVRTAGLRLLLLGDMEPPAQRALARSPAATRLADVDVLKVAHHGFTQTYPLESFRHHLPRSPAACRCCGSDWSSNDEGGARGLQEDPHGEAGDRGQQ
ncbi:ComEC/Rec2 family competence protein [Streptomyces hirsutus]